MFNIKKLSTFIIVALLNYRKFRGAAALHWVWLWYSQPRTCTFKLKVWQKYAAYLRNEMIVITQCLLCTNNAWNSRRKRHYMCANGANIHYARTLHTCVHLCVFDIKKKKFNYSRIERNTYYTNLETILTVIEEGNCCLTNDSLRFIILYWVLCWFWSVLADQSAIVQRLPQHLERTEWQNMKWR